MPFGGETAESYYDEGLTWLMKGDVARAIQSLQKSIELDHSFLAAYHQLAKCHLRIGQAHQAAQLLNHVVTRKPDFHQARLDFGYALLQMNHIAQARSQFSQVLERQPSNARAHLGIAYANFHEGQWDNAVAAAQAARICGGANFAVLFLLGRAAKLAGNVLLADEMLNEAAAVIEKSVELSPDMPEGYYLRGELMFVREQWHDALGQFSAAEEHVAPGRIYSAFGEIFSRTDILAKRGLCMQRLGDLANAREMGRKILQIDPQHKLGQALANL